MPSASSISTWKRATPFRDAAPLVITEHIELKRMQNISRRSSPNSVSQNSSAAPLTAVGGGQAFLVPIQFGDNAVYAVLDTGSSDTWFAQAGFKCVNGTGAEQDPSACRFGPLINGTFSGGRIDDQNFNISYDGGEFANGVLGYENITLAGVTVKQKVALADYAFFQGDGISSGIVGLAYPSITAAFNGTNVTADALGVNQQPYDPLFITMFKQGLVEPMFSIALNRQDGTGPDGYLALGGLPPVNVSGDFVSTPILIGQDPFTNQSTFLYYAVNIDAYTYGTTSVPTQPGSYTTAQAVIDSGASGITLPANISKAVNAAFSPPAKFIPGQGYLVDCKATPPAFSITINGTAFNINPVDLIDQTSADNSTGLCASGVQDSVAVGYPVFGDAFLKNVVAVFDVGAGQMRFAQRSD